MKCRFIDTTKDLMGMIINYIVNTWIWILFSAASETELKWERVAGFVLLPLFYYVVRRYVNKLVVYIAIHAVTAGLCIFLFSGRGSESVVLGIMVALFTISSFVVRLNGEEPGEKAYPILGAVTIGVVVLIVLRYIDDVEYTQAVTKLMLLYITLYLLYGFIRRFAWFDFMNSKFITNMPTKTLFFSNLPYATALCILYALIGFICLNEELIRKIVDSILTFLRNLLVKLLSGIDFDESFVQEINELEPNTLETSFADIPEAEDPALIWVILEKIAIYAAVVIAVLALVFIVVAIVQALIKRFHGIDTSPKKELTDDYVEEREKVVAKSKEKKRRDHLFFTPAEKIRHLYILLVKGNEKIADNPSKFTAREFAGSFPKSIQESAYSFAYIYEKARYSPVLCTSEDVKCARKLAREIRNSNES